MIKSSFLFLLSILTSCAVNATQSNPLKTEQIAKPTANISIHSNNEYVFDEDDGYVKKLSLNGYEFSIKTRPSKPYNGETAQRDYAVISKNGKQIKVFDDFPESKITEYRFKQIPITEKKSKTQVIVESTAPKNWYYRIYNFSAKLNLVFDSQKYNLGHDLEILDIDQDGINEISMDLMTFDYFGINFRKGWVTSQVIFKYDENLNKYIYANKEFKEYLLKNIDSEIAEINKINNEKQNDSEYDRKIYSAVMDVFLTYVYVGEEPKAWEIFEKYNSSDKVEVKAEIKKYLAADSLYKLIYKNSAF